MEESWVLNLREQCMKADVPFFFKQWGGVQKSKFGRLLDNQTYDEMPPRVQNPIPLKADRLAMLDIVDSWQNTPTTEPVIV